MPGYPMATVGQDFAPYARVDGAARRAAATTSRIIADEHTRPGLHHHRPRRQPDHRLPSGRDEAFAREQRRAMRRRRASASSRPTAATAWSQHAAQFAAAGIPFIFDPGPGPADVRRRRAASASSTQAHAGWRSTTTNGSWCSRRPAGRSRTCAERVEALIVTRGARARSSTPTDGELTIPCAKPAAVVDPTGCGDAYRAGLLHGLLHGLDWESTGADRLADGRDQDRDRAARRTTVSRRAAVREQSL